MATYSTNLLQSFLAQGDNAVHGFTHWGDAAVSNFQFLEDTVTEKSDISVTSSDVTLTAAQHRSLYLNCSGLLTGNRNVIVATRKGFWFVYNNTTGSYTLTVKTSAGSGIEVPQGGRAIVVCDGTNVVSIMTVSSAAAGLLDDASVSAMRTTLGLAIGTDVQAYDALLADIANLTISSGVLIYGAGTDNVSVLAPGSDGNFLTLSGGVPAWTAGSFQPLDADLTALAGLTSAADALPYFTGSGTAATTTLTTFGRSLIDDADASAARTTLGLAIGTDVQAYDADLAAIAALTSAANKLPYATGSGTWATTDFTAFARTLLDDADAATARATLGTGVAPDVQTFNSSGTWTKPTGVTVVEVWAWGGGGGGAASSTGGGGGGAACVVQTFSASALGSTVTVTIGAGGAAGTVGGNTSFGTHVFAYGGGGASGGSGGGGGGVAAAGSGANGGAPVNPAAYSATEAQMFGGGYGGTSSTQVGQRSVYGGGGGGNGAPTGAGGGASVYGGGGGGGANTSAAGGTSVFGGAGGAGGAAGSGVAGTQPGGGGGGGATAGTGGAGRVIVYSW